MGQNLSFSLGLAQIPEIKESELFPEFLRIYNAIKLTASQLDSYTGNSPLEDGEEIRPTQINNLLTCTWVCGDAIPTARLVYIQDVGGEARAKLGNNPYLGRSVAIALEEGVVGESARFLLKGTLKFEVGDLTPGATYRHVGSGYIAKDADVTTYWEKQIIGWAIDSAHLWFEPDLTFGGYTSPP